MSHAVTEGRSFLSGPIMLAGIADSFRKLDPRIQVRNPVMFVVEVGSAITTGIFVVISPRIGAPSASTCPAPMPSITAPA